MNVDRDHFDSGEVRQRSECSQRFDFDNSEVKQRSQRFHFSVTYVKKIIFGGLYYNSNSERKMIS